MNHLERQTTERKACRQLDLSELQAVREYQAALWAKRDAAKMLAECHTPSQRDRAYECMDEAQTAVRRALRLLEEALCDV